MNRSRMLSTNSAIDEGEQRAGNYAIALHDFVSRASCEAVAKTENMVQGIIVASHAAVAGIHVLAKIVGRDTGDRPLTATQVLFAALLAYHSSPNETEKGRSTSEFSPIILTDALRDFEKITGRRPDEELEQVMCETCREFITDPVKVAAMQAERAQVLSGVEGQRTLN